MLVFSNYILYTSYLLECIMLSYLLFFYVEPPKQTVDRLAEAKPMYKLPRICILFHCVRIGINPYNSYNNQLQRVHTKSVATCFPLIRMNWMFYSTVVVNVTFIFSTSHNSDLFFSLCYLFILNRITTLLFIFCNRLIKNTEKDSGTL